MQISMISMNQIFKDKQSDSDDSAHPNGWTSIPFVFDYLICILFRRYSSFQVFLAKGM